MSGTRRPHYAARSGSTDDDDAPWERSSPAPKKPKAESNRPNQAVLNRLNRARPPGSPPIEVRPPPPPKAPPKPDPEEFWSSPSLQAVAPKKAGGPEFLSGPDEYFDSATGWDFDAISDSHITAVSGATATVRGAAAAKARSQSATRSTSRPPPPSKLPPAQEAAEFAVEVEVDDAAPLDVDAAIAKAQDCFRQNLDDEAMAALSAADRQSPNHPQVTTWLQFGERRLIARHCNGGKLDRVPNLVHARDNLLAVVKGEQRELVLAVDGSRTAAELREATPGMSAATFWRTLGRLVDRGWVAWGDLPE